ncbi:CBS domain-containing protein [Maridesulfovibrio salexigens]|uniref:CBS domain containing membrane protein n=1 Tax=Maridesulfovibrio salexigens (strain ATCC 14822 / DSM 2638 / NCIMB 8403 / VKM B-1763) TaxID=526222 RepID=C6BTT8_MARSD|nr:CBS domain-containing protein [Maridesulfovibrio salexigens]ACS79868.1 CBS domain containing membrane protein [Maridesulfovibrio salexigens DSM 2638]
MLKVNDLMTTELFTLSESDNLKMARSLMDLQRIRHIPIVNDEREFIGLVTHRDILRATISQLADIDPATQGEIDSGIPVGEIMRTDIKTISEDTSLKEAAVLLLDHKYGCFPVVNEKNGLIGILTEADFLKLTISLMEALEQNDD